MALPPSPLIRLEDIESKLHALSNELQKQEADKVPRTVPSSALEAIQNMQVDNKTSETRVPLPAKYKLQKSDGNGKHVVQYVYASLRDPKDESLPVHVRERYKEIGKERLLGFPNTPDSEMVNESKPPLASSNSAPRRTVRPASANAERRHSPTYIQARQKFDKPDSSIQKPSSQLKSNQKSSGPPVTQTKSSNAVMPAKRASRSESKNSSPRRRRPFSIAADSTSDTDPVENHISMDTIKKNPPRVARNRQARRQQYLATKFKLVAKNSKHTQTFVAALSGLSLDESSGSATTVISRHHSATQTSIPNRLLQSGTSEPDCQIVTSSQVDEQTEKESSTKETEKPPTSPNRDKCVNYKETESTENAENPEWRRAKVRLRSTPRSPSPPPVVTRQRVSSADGVQRSCLAGTRPSSAQAQVSLRTRPNSDGQLITPVDDKRFTTSATQIDVSNTKSTGVQVKLKKRRSSRKKREKRSPSPKSVSQKSMSQRSVSQKSVGSKHSNLSKKEPPQKENLEQKVSKKKKKKAKASKSRDPSVRSLRSLRSLQSTASAGKLKQVQISPRRSSSRKPKRSASVATEQDGQKKKTKKKKKKKSGGTSKNIARFLRQLSRDKEAIKVINKMASSSEKKK